MELVYWIFVVFLGLLIILIDALICLSVDYYDELGVGWVPEAEILK